MDTESGPLTEMEHDIKATGEDIAADAARVHQIEKEKTALHADDPRLANLSRVSEELTARMADKAKVETALVAEVQAQAEAS